MAFVAFYDACVLYPAPLRDLLVELACTNLFRARWTERIHEEWMRSLRADRPGLSAIKLRATADAMNESVEDCLIDGYESLIPTITLPDEDDRHVVAAAVVGRADVIVTLNLKDFPAAALAPFNIEVQHPDVFIRHVLDLDGETLMAVAMCRRKLKNPPKTVEEYLSTLARQGLPETVSFLRRRAHAI